MTVIHTKCQTELQCSLQIQICQPCEVLVNGRTFDGPLAYFMWLLQRQPDYPSSFESLFNRLDDYRPSVYVLASLFSSSQFPKHTIGHLALQLYSTKGPCASKYLHLLARRDDSSNAANCTVSDNPVSTRACQKKKLKS